jgi:hypothetical protein
LIFRNKFILYDEVLLAPSWSTTPCRFSMAAYSIYSQLPSIAGGHSSIRNLSTRHALVTGIILTWVQQVYRRNLETGIFSVQEQNVKQSLQKFMLFEELKNDLNCGKFITVLQCLEILLIISK